MPPRGTGGGGGGGGSGPSGSGGNSSSASPSGDWWTAYLALLDRCAMQPRSWLAGRVRGAVWAVAVAETPSSDSHTPGGHAQQPAGDPGCDGRSAESPGRRHLPGTRPGVLPGGELPLLVLLWTCRLTPAPPDRCFSRTAPSMCAARPSSRPWAAWSSGPSCLPGAPIEQCAPAMSQHHTLCAAPRRYNTLGRLVQGQGAMVAVTKVAVDQLLFAPPFLALILSLCVEAGMPVHAHGLISPLTPTTLPSPLQADDGREWGWGGECEAAAGLGQSGGHQLVPLGPLPVHQLPLRAA